MKMLLDSNLFKRYLIKYICNCHGDLIFVHVVCHRISREFEQHINENTLLSSSIADITIMINQYSCLAIMDMTLSNDLSILTS